MQLSWRPSPFLYISPSFLDVFVPLLERVRVIYAVGLGGDGDGDDDGDGDGDSDGDCDSDCAAVYLKYGCQ